MKIDNTSSMNVKATKGGTGSKKPVVKTGGDLRSK